MAIFGSSDAAAGFSQNVENATAIMVLASFFKGMKNVAVWVSNSRVRVSNFGVSV